MDATTATEASTAHAKKLRTMCRRWRYVMPNGDRPILAALICGYAYSYPQALAEILRLRLEDVPRWCVQIGAEAMRARPLPLGADEVTADRLTTHRIAKAIAAAVNGAP